MKNQRSMWLKIMLWALAIALLAWTLRQVSWQAIMASLRQLTALQLAMLFAINGLIIALFGLRWYLFLREQGYHIPYYAIIRYRLAAFAVSYLTPGPHLGGEPLQIYYLSQEHGVRIQDNLAALSMDKLVEMITNFSVLLLGLAVMLNSGWFGGRLSLPLLVASSALVSLPIVYAFFLLRRLRPISWISASIQAKWLRRAKRAVFAAEKQMVRVIQRAPGVIALAVFASGLVWIVLYFEYWLALRFLGLHLSLVELIVVITSGRLALLTPMPSAIGALEFSQVVALEALGYPAAWGLSISLLIRARDMLFSGIGLAWGRVFGIKI